MAYASKYDYWITEEGLKLIRGWRRKGLSYRDIAKTISVDPSQITKWSKRFPEFKEALSVKPDIAINETENALFKTAKGYWVEEVTREEWVDKNGEKKVHEVTHKRWVQPSIGAQCFVLKNRDPDHWKDKPLDDGASAGEKVEIVVDV